MAYGIGTDIVRVERIREAWERWGMVFLEKIYTPAEIAHCFDRRDPWPSFAVRFAAREALIKALGGRWGVGLREMEVVQNEKGAPGFKPGPALGALLEKEGTKAVHLSLSHEKEYAVAFVIVE